MFSLNKVQLIGNLGNDAEHRFTNNNVAVTSFSIATTNSYKNKEDVWVNETTWHDVTAFGLPDFHRENLLKGKKVYVEGKLVKEEYTDKEGVDRKVTKIIADKFRGIVFLSETTKSESSEDVPTPDVATPQEDDDLPF